MFARNTTSPAIDAAVATSVNFELTLADIARRSERRAWWIAGAAIAMAMMLAFGLFYVLPLKEKVPYIVMADAYSGTATLANLTGDFTHRRIATSEAVNRSNIAHFILAREAYDIAMMNLRDWTTVLTMSAPEVATPYRALHAPSNPDAPYHLYGRERAVRVKILSIVLIIGDPAQPPKGATVRFQRSIYNKRTGSIRPLDSKIATLGFAYKPNLKMDEQNRIENPLGFQVTSYRVDNDFSSPAPMEVEAPKAFGHTETTPINSTSEELSDLEEVPGSDASAAPDSTANGTSSP